MVAIDTSTGAPVRVSGAALAGGPALVLSRAPRVDQTVQGAAGGGFSRLLRRGAMTTATPAAATGAELVQGTRSEPLPARWGVPAFFAGAPYGPPYELLNRTAEWALSAETSQPFTPVDRQARMAHRVHPKGPSLQSAGTFLAALYGATPVPLMVGGSVDASR